jgi:hypothetical protein
MKNPCLLLILGLLFACNPQKQGLQTLDFKAQWDTLRVLENPHKGWYHHLLDNGIDKYAISNDSLFSTFPAMDHLYVRLAWSYLEPSEGHFDWHRIDEVVEKYVPLGYKIAFRISCKETGPYPGSVGQQNKGVQYATPVWVEKAGAKGVVAQSGNIRSWVPDWDDPVYLEKLDHFHRAFAARYDSQPWVSYIDIGSIGEWGEGHTSFSTKIPPSVEEVKANIDVYLKNYQHSQLIVTDDLLYYGKPEKEDKALYDYVVSKGISLRDDSPLVEWYMQQNLDTWSVSHPQFYDPLYLTKPIVFELQHYGVVKTNGNWLGSNGAVKIEKYGYSGAEVMTNAIKAMHATYIGYHGYAEEWLADNPELTKQLANLCGYWYFPVSVSYSPVMNPGTNEISVQWLNKGVAPAYNDFSLTFKFESHQLQNSFTLSPMPSGNKSWLPGTSTDENYRFELPAQAAKGTYTLKFRLEETSGNETRRVELGIKESRMDKDGFIELGNIQLK